MTVETALLYMDDSDANESTATVVDLTEDGEGGQINVTGTRSKGTSNKRIEVELVDG